ncbi:MAG: helix-turn-helix domain-containing protein [Bacteroidales bacterium]|nr:helix-turn-helix domain-containing protein [Bacteroidales bacterium]MCF8458810.1 helix-turn-helix domain-containing protein [Bacteroidales bacterium]
MEKTIHKQTNLKKIIEGLPYRDCLSMRKLIAKTCLVDKATVSNWENGKSRPTSIKASAVASLLGLPVDEVFPIQ